MLISPLRAGMAAARELMLPREMSGERKGLEMS